MSDRQAPMPQADGTPAGHQCFTVASTSYLRTLAWDDRTRECVAVHYQKPPRRNENGTITLSLNVPMLVVTLYLSEQREIAERIAAILNRYWDSFNQPASSDETAAADPDPRDAVVTAARAVMARYLSEQFMRSADAHSAGCQCRRCEFDALEAALEAVPA